MSRIEPVAVALDTAERETFERWAAFFGPRVGVLKVGLEAFVRFGPAAVEAARRAGGRVFLDLKLHDIPNTVAGAVASALELGADFLTVHAGGGPAMLEAAVRAAGGRLGVLAVTVLTHLDAAELARLDLPGTAAERALAWARLAREAGCAGVVCSPRELAALRPVLPRPFLLVTPGIRPAGAEAGDQKRTATPAAALAAGADLLVVGRPLTGAPDPDAALAALAAELARAAAG
ncbi:MAG: orotidine 5'-phosphate decarboxylase [Acidobacteria bacterium]|nr:orotidine 5'-phosphate decarboxylase [Acidobacteriota bacterium]